MFYKTAVFTRVNMWVILMLKLSGAEIGLPAEQTSSGFRITLPAAMMKWGKYSCLDKRMKPLFVLHLQ